MVKKEFIIDLIIISVILLFLQFFSLKTLDDSRLQLAALFVTGIILMTISFIGLIFKKRAIEQNMDILVFIFILCMIVSTFMANIYWEQSFLSSLKSYRSFYIYFLYFVLIFLNIPPERIERIIILLFFASLVVFLIDYKTFPNPMFSSRDEERRGGLTIFFSGQGFTFLGAFYFLNKSIFKRNLFYLLFFIISFICLFFLTQSRMVLTGLVVGFFLILLSSNLKKKYLYAILIIIGGAILYSSASLFEGIKDTSKEEAQFYKENIRVSAHQYFLTELQGGLPTMILGNGFPGVDGNLSLEITLGNSIGYWQSDVGLTGVYSYFGVLGVIIWLLFFYSVFKMKNTQNTIYLKGYFIALLASSLTGYAIFDPSYMPATILALYLTRCAVESEKETNELETQEQLYYS